MYFHERIQCEMYEVQSFGNTKNKWRQSQQQQQLQQHIGSYS